MAILKKTNIGFTLLELLLALSLSTLLMLVLASGMFTVLKDWGRTSHHLEDSLDQILILLQIERAIEGAFPHIYLNKDENKKYLFFEGEETHLAWVSTISPGRQSGLTIWVLEPNEEETGIQIRIMPAFASDPTEQLETQTTAITALPDYKLHFEYLYIDETLKEDTKWLTQWSARKRQSLPYAVRIYLEHKTDPTEQSMEIVAVIQAHEHESLRPIKPESV